MFIMTICHMQDQICVCYYFYPLSFGHCVVCPFSIDGFRLPLWYLHTKSVIISRRSLDIEYVCKILNHVSKMMSLGYVCCQTWSIDCDTAKFIWKDRTGQFYPAIGHQRPSQNVWFTVFHYPFGILDLRLLIAQSKAVNLRYQRCNQKP
jgi:hypothetical protein